MRKILFLIVLISSVFFLKAQIASISPSGTVTICTGSSLQLSSNTGPGFTYQWYLNSKVLAGQTSSILLVTTSGKYSVKISIPGGEATSQPTTVSVVAPPKAIINYRDKTLDICATGSIELRANKINGASYQWYKNGSPVAGSTQQTYTVSEAGTYMVSVIPYDRCSTTSEPVTVTNSCPKIAGKGVDKQTITQNFAYEHLSIPRHFLPSLYTMEIFLK